MIPILQLSRQLESIRAEIDAAIAAVLDSGWFVLGSQVEAFEEEFARYCGTKYCVGVASGLDALQLAMVACGVGPGMEVVTVANAVFAGVAAEAAGATPRFVDIEETSYLLDPERLDEAITEKTKAIVPVHLYGQTADMAEINRAAEKHDIIVIEDACQAHGAEFRGAKAGALADAGCFSFYPSKNLGACGEAGAVTTDDEGLADEVRMLRNYGKEDRYRHKLRGRNSRLDEIQAAILRVKLRHLDEWNNTRRELAAFYNHELENLLVVCPAEMPWARHVYHLYVIRTSRRDALMEFLRGREVGTQIHYPIPAHKQEAFAHLRVAPDSLAVTERVCNEILSLPLWPELSLDEARAVAEAVKAFFSEC